MENSTRVVSRNGSFNCMSKLIIESGKGNKMSRLFTATNPMVANIAGETIIATGLNV